MKHSASGTVAFVSTSICGSSGLRHRAGVRYPLLLDRHDELLRAAWRLHGGAELQTIGGEWLVAFADASAALTACVDAQRSLSNEDWPEGCAVRIRIGMHAGMPTPGDDHYGGLAARRTARIVFLAHGGQILLSAGTLLKAFATEGIRVRTLGRYRIKDFDHPVELYQAYADGLQTEFPPLHLPHVQLTGSGAIAALYLLHLVDVGRQQGRVVAQTSRAVELVEFSAGGIHDWTSIGHESAVRGMSQLRKLGLIETARRAVRILDVSELERYVEAQSAM